MNSKFIRAINRLILPLLSPKQRAMYYKKIGYNIGNFCEIYPNVVLGREPYLVNLGDYVRITSDVKFITHDGAIWVIRNKFNERNGDIFGRISVGNNVHIGVNSIIMPNVSIGNNVVIGAGSIVTKDIPDNCVAAGVPAKVIRTIDEYYEKNKNRIINTKNISNDKKEEMLRSTFSQLDCQ